MRLKHAAERAREGASDASWRLAPGLSARLSIERQVNRYVIPRGCTSVGARDEFPADELACPGIALDDDAQLSTLERWSGYHELYALLRREPRLNRLGGETSVRNGWYETPDAEVYGSLICDTKPRHIIEIGVGHSTLAARIAIDWAGTGTRLIAVDKHARTSVATAADVVLPDYLEDVDWTSSPFPSLSEPVMLFIDSSHIVRAGGDIPILFNELVPRLAPGSLVHVHDVFTPWDYPISFRRRLYTEQYVLQALLCHSHRYRTVFATHYMSRTHPEPMRRIISPDVGRCFGSSYWFSVEQARSLGRHSHSSPA